MHMARTSLGIFELDQGGYKASNQQQDQMFQAHRMNVDT